MGMTDFNSPPDSDDDDFSTDPPIENPDSGDDDFVTDPPIGNPDSGDDDFVTDPPIGNPDDDFFSTMPPIGNPDDGVNRHSFHFEGQMSDDNLDHVADMMRSFCSMMVGNTWNAD